MPRALWLSQGKVLFLMSEVPLYSLLSSARTHTPQSDQGTCIPRVLGWPGVERVLNNPLFCGEDWFFEEQNLALGSVQDGCTLPPFPHLPV